MLERIESNYVDDVAMEPLVRHGIDNLEVALRDPVFIKVNAPAAAPERLAWFRDVLRGYRSTLAVADRATALRMALTCGEVGRQAIGLAATPVLLEFTCGAFDALDDFSSYLTPDKLEDLYAMIDGNFVGLGIELKLDKEGLRLMGVLRGGPAWEAGLQPGETIIKVNGVSIKGMSLDESANKLQGTEGSAVDLVVTTADGTARSLHLVRRHVDVESVTRARLLERTGGIGYLRLTGFQKTSADELDAAIGALGRAGDAGPGARPAGEPRRPPERGRRHRRAVRRQGGDRHDPGPGAWADAVLRRRRPGPVEHAPVYPRGPR